MEALRGNPVRAGKSRAADAAHADTVVLLAAHDPDSQSFLGSALREGNRLSAVRTVDSRLPLSQWPLDRVDVVVLALEAGRVPADAVRTLAAAGIPALLVGTGWTRRPLEAAFAAGAAGCLVRAEAAGGLAAAALAVASGHRLLSPQLLDRGLPGLPAAEAPAIPAPRAGPRPAHRPQDLPPTLTAREHEVFALLAAGLSTAEAASSLNVSPSTVKSHISHVLTKLGARSRLEAVLLMQQMSAPGRGRQSLTG